MTKYVMIETVMWDIESNVRQPGSIATSDSDAYFFVAMEIPITTAMNKEANTVSLWATVSDSSTVVVSIPLSIPANIAMGILRLKCEEYYAQNTSNE